ncbi:MAG TPA: S46 family peptidase [Pyrinomonadaceae bacterium]|nr:S46 family peptidase [Chloracidobacterium sp.]MBP9934896.1 S46 family peptidase [Pyrinomonadaceae bacterium]MBK7803324.1 S46 family peptidase [Chloracidobacterium sp.]MBK9438574.1 S46 family peptidase [Chloracidobacterium sp.]MBL0241097.1 S46 family peptidase [Chloracidobacterium sp.]
MKRISAIFLLLSFVLNASSVLADEGMWTFDNPPLKQWKERYNFEPSKEWLDNVRLASPKVNGSSAGFVSPNGLIATNHHVAAGYIERVSSKERDLLKTGFYAGSQAAELKIPDASASVLVAFDNVTDRVHSAATAGKTDAEMAAKRTAEISAIEKDCTATAGGLNCQVVSFYSGGEYWLYKSKIYRDIRLVMAPEEQAAFFGGDYDNFVFPRHDLDFTFLRAYENDKPAATPNYFKWSEKGAADGEFILVSGYPGSTARLLTVSQLTYQRDIGNPLQKKVWELRRKALENYSKKGDEQHRQAWPGMRGFANSLKRLEGQQDGLLNPRNYGQKVAEEKDLRDKLAAKPELDKQFAPAWKNIGDAYAKLPAMANRLAFSNISASRLASIAQQLVTYSIEAAKPNDLRYPEFRDTRLEAIKSSLASPAPIYLDMEEASLLFWMEEAVKTLGVNDSFVKAAIGNAEPSEVVKRAIRETKLNDPAARLALFDGGAAAIAASTDPMVTLARRVEPVIRELREWNEKTIQNVETANGTKIAQARFAVYGKTMPPDANSTLRIEYGKVLGYDEDTTLVPYKTTFFGLYDRAFSFGEKSPFELAPSLKARKDKIDLSTPLNFVYSADTIGGNSGSPVINRAGEIVGLNFDSNNQKLSNRYWYIEENEGSRAVGVHTAGILEALRKVYDAPGLVRELTGK